MALQTLSVPELLVTPALPFAAALVILAVRSRAALRDAVPVAAALATFLSVIRWLPAVRGGTVPCALLCELYPGISLRFSLDGMGLLFAATASLLWAVASIYCSGYLRVLNEHAQTRFYVCYTLAVGGAMGAALAGNLFTLYLCYEIVTIVTYPLVAHHQDAHAYRSGRQYLVYLVGASKLFLLAGLALIYAVCGTLDMNIHDISRGIFPEGAPRLLIIAAYGLCVAGCAKAAVMPLHNWLPAAMVAPTPVSALLHAVVVVKVGVFSICRIMLCVFGTDLLGRCHLGAITAALAAVTIIAGSLIAMAKSDLKARLAYSTVSQLSYIILGVAMLGPAGMTGGLAHIANHAFAKISLFFCAGAIIAATGLTDIRDMAGIGRKMPLTMAAFGIASLSMIGVPPVGGFVSKWYLAIGALDLRSGLLLGVILVSSLLNAFYFGEVFITAFFSGRGQAGAAAPSLEAAPLMRCMVIPTAAAALLSVCAGVFPDLVLSLISIRIGP